MEGFAHIIAGSTGTGKTTFTKQMLKMLQPKFKELFIYDVNNEYGEFYNKKFEKFTDFMNRVLPVKDSIIVFEEATIFLNHHNTNAILIEKLVRKRHENNCIICNFHSLRKVPIYIFDLSNYITIFKTIDNLEFVKKKFGDIDAVVKAVDFISVSENKHINKTIQLY